MPTWSGFLHTTRLPSSIEWRFASAPACRRSKGSALPLQITCQGREVFDAVVQHDARGDVDERGVGPRGWRVDSGSVRPEMPESIEVIAVQVDDRLADATGEHVGSEPQRRRIVATQVGNAHAVRTQMRTEVVEKLRKVSYRVKMPDLERAVEYDLRLSAEVDVRAQQVRRPGGERVDEPGEVLDDLGRLLWYAWEPRLIAELVDVAASPDEELRLPRRPHTFARIAYGSEHDPCPVDTRGVLRRRSLQPQMGRPLGAGMNALLTRRDGRQSAMEPLDIEARQVGHQPLERRRRHLRYGDVAHLARRCQEGRHAAYRSVTRSLPTRPVARRATRSWPCP